MLGPTITNFNYTPLGNNHLLHTHPENYRTQQAAVARDFATRMTSRRAHSTVSRYTVAEIQTRTKALHSLTVKELRDIARADTQQFYLILNEQLALGRLIAATLRAAFATTDELLKVMHNYALVSGVIRSVVHEMAPLYVPEAEPGEQVVDFGGHL